MPGTHNSYGVPVILDHLTLDIQYQGWVGDGLQIGGILIVLQVHQADSYLFRFFYLLFYFLLNLKAVYMLY